MAGPDWEEFKKFSKFKATERKIFPNLFDDDASLKTGDPRNPILRKVFMTDINSWIHDHSES